MRRHRFDALSFVFGIVFLFIAVGASVEWLAMSPQGLRWIAAAVLLVIGAVLLLTSRSEVRDRP